MCDARHVCAMLLQREQLVSLQAQALALQADAAGPVLVAIQHALQVLEAQGCVCGSSLHTKGSTLTCVGCRKKLHPACIGLRASDPRIASAPNSYLCAPCRRKGRTVPGDAAWTQGEAAVSFKMPAGWIQTFDAAGQLVFVQRAGDGSMLQMSRAPPPSSVAVIPCAANPCAARAPGSAQLCQVCFEEDQMLDVDGADAAGDCPSDNKAAQQAALAQEVARERGALLSCLECGVRVHEGCYLGQPLPEAAGASQQFLCRPCEFGVRSVGCVLCGQPGGAMSPATCGGWVHVSCALWAPKGSGVEFEDVSAKDAAGNAARECDSASAGAGGKEGASKPRRRLDRVRVPETFKVVDVALGKEGKDGKRRASGGGAGSGCQLCRASKGGGVFVRCQEKGCKMSAHPLCALEHGWYLLETRSGVEERADAPAADASAEDGKKKARREKKGTKGPEDKGRMHMERFVFCQEHAPEEDEDDTLYCICQTRSISVVCLLEILYSSVYTTLLHLPDQVSCVILLRVFLLRVPL